MLQNRLQNHLIRMQFSEKV